MNEEGFKGKRSYGVMHTSLVFLCGVSAAIYLILMVFHPALSIQSSVQIQLILIKLCCIFTNIIYSHT